MHSQVTPPLRPYETPTPPDSEGEDEPEEEEENEEEEVESVFIPISFSFFTLLPLFFPGGVGGRENSKVRDTSKRLLLLLVGLGPQQHAGGAGRGLRVGNFGIFVVLVLGFRSASTMGDSPRGGSAAAPFPSLSVPPPHHPHHNHFQVQLQEEIGRGRYGVAFRGRYKGRVVAVKVSSSSS